MPNEERKRVPIPPMEAVEAERKRLKFRAAYRKAFRETVFSLLIVAALAVLIATLVLPVIQISGTSMEPTLEDGDIAVLIKTDRFETGDLCAFYFQNKLLLKRVIGNPGDYIEIDEEGTVYVNGEVIDEPYLVEKSLGECDINFPFQVPENKYFVLGDQRETSIDSRSSVIGCIEKDQIVGRILFRIWPLEKISAVR